MKTEILIILTFLTLNCSSFGQEQADTTEVVQLKSFGDMALLKDSSTIIIQARFTVGANGKVSSIEIIKNSCKTCSDKEKKEINDLVIDLIRKNPIAPRKDGKGKPKRTTYIQPFIFKLEEE